MILNLNMLTLHSIILSSYLPAQYYYKHGYCKKRLLNVHNLTMMCVHFIYIYQIEWAWASSVLDLCVSSGHRILNGHKIGDMFGSCTYFGPMCKKPTLLYYGLVHKNSFSDVNLQNLCHLSDYCLIYAHITCNPTRSNEGNRI